MLHLIKGRAGSGKTAKMREIISRSFNFTNEFDESDFEAVTVKIDGGYKLAISKHNDKIKHKRTNFFKQYSF